MRGPVDIPSIKPMHWSVNPLVPCFFWIDLSQEEREAAKEAAKKAKEEAEQAADLQKDKPNSRWSL